MIRRIVFLWGFLSLFTSFLFAGTYYVAPNGVDAPGGGTPGNPWATLTYACTNIPDDGSTVLAMNGTYNGRVRLNRRFTNHTTFKAMNPYLAVLQHTNEQVLTSFGGANFTIEGFRFTRPVNAPAALIVQIQQAGSDGSVPAEDIIIRNNIFHDSYNNDLLKINNVCDNILVEGNLFYNQSGSDEHIDVNGVTNVTIQDNVFFNDFAGSGRPNNNDTSSYIVIKNSGDLPLNQDFIVRRNIFLNWEGSTGSNFLLIGEDGKPFIEAQNLLVENNLMIGNSANTMRAAFGVKSGKNVTFRNNTVVGNLPSLAFALRINRENATIVNEDIFFYNNIWSDPTTTMEDFSDGEPVESTNVILDNNLYYNGGNALPPGDVLSPSDDANAVIGNPVLTTQAGLVLPRWVPASQQFLSGNTTIRDEFLRLASTYGSPGSGSAAFDASDPTQTPADDILGNARDSNSDLGDLDTDSVGVLITVNPSSLPNGSIGTPYSQMITASGGTAPYSFAVTSGTLPNGLNLNSNGLLSGDPTTTGTFNFTVTATDSNTDTGSRAYTIQILACTFCDDFGDGVLDWLYTKPAWTEPGGTLVGTPSGKKAIALATPLFPGCVNCTVEAVMRTAGGIGNRVWLFAWYLNKKNTLEVMMKEQSDAWVVKQKSGGRVVAKGKGLATIMPGVDYLVRVTYNGTQFQLFVDDVLLLTLPDGASASGTVGFQVKSTTGTFGSINVF
jgi:hypothetical protein